MRFAINLRRDLAKLGDADLAARLEQARQDYHAADQLNAGKLWYSRRGPIRHPWIYRLFSVAGMSRASGFYFGFGPFVRYSRATDMHLILCEIRDLTDEMEQRMRGKRE